MDSRKSALLSAIIKEHINSSQAVGSKVIVDKYDFKLSPATVRHEMMNLDKEGYIYQPHTSAGRVPTEKGWQFYINHFLKDRELTKREKKLLENASLKTKESYESLVKNVAKVLAELSQDAVIVGFAPENVYYTGLSNLFKQPEFKQLDMVWHISQMVDHLDEVMKKIFDEITEEIKVIIGRENPFGAECGSILSRYYLGKDKYGMFGILGPMRMEYENNLALIKYTKNLLGSIS